MRAAAVLRGARLACGAALEESDGRVFVCGDAGAASLPPRFRDLAAGVAAAGAVVARFDAKVDAIVAREGWPPDPAVSGRIRAARLHLDGDAACWKCEGRTFQRAWARDGVCWGCEREERREGRCPRGEKGCPVRRHGRRGAASGFCAHARRCVGCDAHSCAQCALLRATATTSRAYRELRGGAAPPCLFLDFDRTLCSTRSGADPMAPSAKDSKKAVSSDEALVELLAEVPAGSAFVVTRNARREAIEAYLKTLHLDHVVVRSVKRERLDKADGSGPLAKKRAAAERREREEKSRVIYIGHIPDGFFEDQMRGFFGQFGEVTNLRISRSKKTGNSKGYGFVEFADGDTAAVAAGTMDKYLLYGKQLVVHVAPLDLARHPKLFAHSDKPFLKRRGGKEQREKSLAAAKAKTDEQRAAGAAALLKKEAKKRKRLAENFPGFDFPGYAGAAQGARRPDDDGAPKKKKSSADPEKKAAKKAKKAKKWARRSAVLSLGTGALCVCGASVGRGLVRATTVLCNRATYF
ncbi:RNA binding-protein [Aureococcus anophagefferens]|nr:RNA binding-protein [Aureococcus anophagefferens]